MQLPQSFGRCGVEGAVGGERDAVVTLGRFARHETVGEEGRTSIPCTTKINLAKGGAPASWRKPSAGLKQGVDNGYRNG